MKNNNCYDVNTAHRYNVYISTLMKKVPREMQNKHSALAVVRRSQNFLVPPQTPFPGAQDG